MLLIAICDRINVLGIFNLCKAVLPSMMHRNYGRIINIASISGKEGNPGQSAVNNNSVYFNHFECVEYDMNTNDVMPSNMDSTHRRKVQSLH